MFLPHKGLQLDLEDLMVLEDVIVCQQFLHQWWV